jgi:hypothetical protein
VYHQALLFASLFLVFYIFNLFFVFTFSSVRSSLPSQGRVAPCGLPRACLFFNSIFQTCWRDGCDDCVGAFVLTDFFFLFLLLPLLWFIRCVRNSRGAATRIFLTHSHLQRGHQPLLLLVHNIQTPRPTNRLPRKTPHTPLWVSLANPRNTSSQNRISPYPCSRKACGNYVLLWRLA